MSERLKSMRVLHKIHLKFVPDPWLCIQSSPVDSQKIVWEFEFFMIYHNSLFGPFNSTIKSMVLVLTRWKVNFDLWHHLYFLSAVNVHEEQTPKQTESIKGDQLDKEDSESSRSDSGSTTDKKQTTGSQQSHPPSKRSRYVLWWCHRC